MILRVLHVIDHLGYGGAPLVVRNIVERLDRSRVEPIVCALRANPESIDIEADVVTLNTPRYGLSCITALKRLVEEHDIDLIHAHLQKSIVCSLIAPTTRPVVIHEHGGILRTDSMGRIYRGLLRILKKRIHAAIGISQVTAERFQQVTSMPANRVVTIANFIDTRRFDRSLYDPDKIRQQWSLPENETVLGFVGRLDRCKGADILINAVALLRKRGITCHAMIVGEGNQRKALQAQIQKLELEHNVTLAGLIHNPAEWMAGFDIGVVPSRREGFGVVAAEYLAMGVPVVAANTGGLPEVIDDDQTGCLVQPDNPHVLAQTLGELLMHPERLATMRQQALTAGSRFDGSRQVQQLQDLYETWCR